MSGTAAPCGSTSVSTIERTIPPPTGLDLAHKLQRLSIGRLETVCPKIQPKRTTSVKEISNCSASCSHDNPRSKRFRPYNSRKTDSRESLLKPSESSAIRKKSTNLLSAKTALSIPTNFRPRAKSIGGTSQLLQGSFGPICRKMVSTRRRKSFSTSSTSEKDRFQSVSEFTEIIPSGVKKACGQEANSPDLPMVETGEVEELAEYFEHFVNVRLKMSAQAESMYV